MRHGGRKNETHRKGNQEGIASGSVHVSVVVLVILVESKLLQFEVEVAISRVAPTSLICQRQLQTASKLPLEDQ